MQEIRCPKCGEVFQVDETGYDQIAQQVRDKEFEKELERRKSELNAKHERSLEIIRLQEEKEYNANIAQKDAEISSKDQKISELQGKLNVSETEKRLAISAALEPKISDLRAVDRSREPLKSLRHLEPRGKSGVDFYLKLRYNIIQFNEVQRWPQTPIKK